MDSIHRYIGEGLFVVYIVAMIVALIMARRGQRPPTWLIAGAHGLLGLQVLLGLIILLTDGLLGVPWYHPVLGLAAIAALGLTPLLRERFQRGADLAVIFGIVAVLTLAAQLAARLG
jgi:heme A synthase